MLKLEYSYLSLPTTFYQLVKPASFNRLKPVLLNEALAEALNIPVKNQEDLISFLSGNQSADQTSFAQAYAGHQFGNFTKLGDGRAIVLGEYINPAKQRFDIQLKGSGRTRYSRGGDGMATLTAMLREYLMSEAMYFLKIPTSRSLVVAKTGEQVQRETIHEGAVLARVMKSHLRIGTFEYARHFGTVEELKALTHYTVRRLYPEIEQEENQALGLLKKVMAVQIDLVANWMRVGFIHGVMNTDNVSLSGETFDYGPCAFMNAYHPGTVFSSIDTKGRYAFGNQPKIIKWNITRFAEALLPLIHSEPDKAVQLAQSCMDAFDNSWLEKYYQTMLLKLGIETASPDLHGFIDELLALMLKLKLDYTNTFAALTYDKFMENSALNNPEFQAWADKWKSLINSSLGIEQARKVMKENNPAFIPRNYLAEEALAAAAGGNPGLLEQLLAVLSKPYEYQENLAQYAAPPNEIFENNYATYCGT